MVLSLSLIALVFGLLTAEAWILRRSVNAIALRIHVNGTRGKSGITSYIAAALRSAGIQTLGKVTGEIPALILPDGTRQTLKRRGPARIQEQFRIIRRTGRMGAKALVLECMSIDPALQETESRHFRPLIYVLSNIRDDHREKLGSTHRDQVRAMCQAIPPGCVVVSGDLENLEAISAEAKKKKCRLLVPGEWTPGPDTELPTGVFPENIALAAEVASQAGVPREEAIRSILEEISNKEATASGEFLNAFSVNDPDSTTVFLDRWREKAGMPQRMILVFNTRADRPERTDAFTQWIRERRGLFAGICITGDHRARAYARLKDLQPETDVTTFGPRQLKGLRQVLIDRYGKPLPVVGIGNIGGAGFRILKEYKA